MYSSNRKNVFARVLVAKYSVMQVIQKLLKRRICGMLCMHVHDQSKIDNVDNSFSIYNISMKYIDTAGWKRDASSGFWSRT